VDEWIPLGGVAIGLPPPEGPPPPRPRLDVSEFLRFDGP
jgi:hypothetical protein